jgi:hypothetical protein
LLNVLAVIQARLPKMELADMARKKTLVRRPWTSADVRELKSLAKKKGGVAKIAKALKRTTRAVENKSYLLGVSLDTRG